MQFESSSSAAQRLNLNIRTVQKWAKAGKIPGAKKEGRDWLIPTTAMAPGVTEDVNPQGRRIIVRMPLPLLGSSFPLGKCMDYINSIPDEDDRNIALAEYYYYSGQAERSAEIVEPYLDSPDASLRYSAGFTSIFANLFRGHIRLAAFATSLVSGRLVESLKSDTSPQMRAFDILTAYVASVLLHLPIPETPPLEEYLHYLPGGVKLFGCYILAYKSYKEKNYERAIAIADMGLALGDELYPIASVYAHIIAASSLMGIRKTEEAKNRFEMAWELAQADGLIEAFGDHHSLLHGLIEVYFKRDHPDDYKRITNITYSYGAGWRRLHNMVSVSNDAKRLSAVEFTVAMLYNRGWTVKEIATHIDVSIRTVNNYIQIIYDKLSVTSKKELRQFMIR